MSNTTRVIQAQQAAFLKDGTISEERATIGKPLTINCQHAQQSIPSPTFREFTWKADKLPWSLSQRAQIDDNGMFAHNRPIGLLFVLLFKYCVVNKPSMSPPLQHRIY